jgi:DNA-binding transcriptional ArsR family regulator
MAAHDTDISVVAGLLADRARAAMLTSLLGGKPLSAGELARMAGVTPQTASAHLAKLLDGGLVTVIAQGRHRYYDLAGPEVAGVIEILKTISPPVEVRSLKQSRAARALADARTCYDHLAGRAGVALHGALLDNGLLDRDSYRPTGVGERVLGELGLDLGTLARSRRRFAGPCLDWTERRHHMNGVLAAALLDRLLDLGWFEQGAAPRALVMTERGRAGFGEVFGCRLVAAA